MSNPLVLRWSLLVIISLWSGAWAASEPPAAWTESVLAEDEWQATFAGSDLEDTFEAVARGVRYEPYPGVMRGPQATAIAGAGNAWDQSLLLATLLRKQGYQVRFARGQLEGENRQVLLRGLYPPVLPSARLEIDFIPYDLADDQALAEIASDHLWVEVAQGDDWLPLDPAFPRALPGAAYASVDEYFSIIPKPSYTRIAITMKQTTATGETRELFTVEDTVEQLALRPLWLTITSSPLMPAEKKRRAATLSFSAPSEPEEPDAPPERKGTNHHWAWGQDQLETRRGTVTVLDEEPGLSIEREWLEMVIGFPDGRHRTVERDLWGEVASNSTGFRRYQLLIAPGRVPLSHVEAIEQRASSHIDLGQLKQRLPAAGSGEDPASAWSLEQSVGTLVHYLLALRFAAESDELTDRIAWVNGVAPLHHQPRLLITSSQSEDLGDGSAATRMAFDLRLDEVQALPFPGFPQRVAALFQTARGMQESVLEGVLLAEVNSDASGMSTARLMELAVADQVPLKVLYGLGEDLQALPPPVEERVQAALASGARIIIPERAISLNGEDRWGWWQIEPASGSMVGVMDNGLHAGMTEYSLDLSKIALDDRMGMAIGAIVGATSTHITIAALILEHGEYGPGLVEAVTKILERITCLSCPESKASAGAGAGASASVSIAGDCLSESKEIGVGGEVGVNVKVGSFCDAYVRGFKCASGLILNGLTTEMSTSVSAGVEANVSFGCD